MSTALAVKDSATMLRRNLLHIRRYPSLSIMLVAQPILFLLLFVYVFGGTMGAGLPGHEGAGDRSDYLVYIAPGILILRAIAPRQGWLPIAARMPPSRAVWSTMASEGAKVRKEITWTIIELIRK